MKKILILIFVNLVIFSSLFLIFEFIVRNFTGKSMVVRQIESGNPFTMADKFYLVRQTSDGNRLVRNARVMLLNHELTGRDVPINTNKQGFRYDDLTDQKPDNERRILFLGDSVTLDDYLPQEETFTRLGEAIASRNTGGVKYKFINAGIGDIGTKEEVDVLQEEGLSTNPDLIVLDFYLNDSRPPWGFDNELGKPGWLRQNSYAIRWLYQRFNLQRWYQQKGEERMKWVNGQYQLLHWREDLNEFRELTTMAKYDWGAAWQPDSWDVIKQQLLRLKSISDGHHIPVAIIAFPTQFQLKTVFVDTYPQDQLHELSELLGFKYFDLLPVLREINSRDDQEMSPSRKELYLDQAHLTSYGNKSVAEPISSFVLSIIGSSQE